MSVISLLGGLFSNGLNYSLNERTNAQNMRIMQMQNTFNRQMQQEQNAYNDPTAQMERLKKAGINPALAYSNGVANTAHSLPQSSGSIPMSAFHSDLGELGNRMSLDALRNQEIDESTSRIKLNGANTLLVSKNTDLTSSQIDKVKAECNVLGEQIGLIQAQTANLQSDTGLKNWQIKFNEKTENDQVKKIANEAGMSELEMKYLAATLQERTTGVRLLNFKQRAEIQKLRNENKKYNEYIDAVISVMQANASKTGMEFNLLETFGATEKALQLANLGMNLLSELGLTSIVGSLMKSYTKDFFKRKKGFVLRYD